jgi:hypothetical protein
MRGYRAEPLLLALVAVLGLGLVFSVTEQDRTRLALSQAIVDHGTLRTDAYQRQFGDKALYGRHFYTDKAPGLSFLAVPTYALLRGLGLVSGSERRDGVWHSAALLWVLRLMTGGIFFVLGAFLVGRAADALLRGYGGLAVAVYGLGTLALPLGATMFSHVAVGTLGLGAFLLLWRPSPGRELAAGAVLGAVFLVEYQGAIFAAVAFAYLLATRRGLAAVVRVAIGAAPLVGALAAYDAAAFGSPLHLSYRYVSGQFASRQQGGFFGTAIPSLSDVKHVLVGNEPIGEEGLITHSPILLLAACGLVLLWRRGERHAAAVCATVTAAFFIIDAGYWIPFGGTSPGPRFFAPALPFLALGVGDAFRRWPRLTLIVAVYSGVSMAGVTVKWSGVPLLFLASVPQRVIHALLVTGALVALAAPWLRLRQTPEAAHR